MFDRILEHQRIALLASLGGIVILAWLAIWQFTRRMSADTAMTMPEPLTWSASDVGLTFVMWSVMMVAMMTPSVAPTLLLYARIERERVLPFARVWIFLFGYLCVWFGFSALATIAQWALHAATLARALGFSSAFIGGAVLILAGIFQWTPLKQACLAHCRSPQSFFLTEWRDGARGALAMGIKHGMYCLGCCWLLMALFFIVGAMNLVWMLALTIFILVEKVAPSGEWVSRAAGIVFVAGGIWYIADAIVAQN